jgi:hypothetical protein
MKIQLFPLVMIALNFAAALVSGWNRDYRRSVYFLASALCVLAVSWDQR